jgi:branched-chain amino acid transport system substrate-binding protein
MTSEDMTAGAGATLQPMNSQIAPVEERYAKDTLHVQNVTMLVDETPNGAFTSGMASRLQAALEAAGASVTRLPVEETATVGAGYYAGKVAEALATHPDLVYVSTYFPEGIEIAKALTAAGATPPCLMGLANVDNAFLEGTTLAQAQRCVFSGVPAAGEMPSADRYVRAYTRAFHTAPGVWGTFTYDSANILFRAINRAKAPRQRPVLKKLRATADFRGATGSVTIDPKTGYRVDPPVSILRVDSSKTFVIATAGR